MSSNTTTLMAESCIVCLADLASLPTQDRHQLGPAQTTSNDFQPPKIEDDPSTVAHLLPCGHNLHHECLRPWVERANSCPMCRANFNTVELCTYLNGPCVTSYAVQEKRQVADVDPSVIVDDELFDDPTWQPCLLCEVDADDDVLLLCDGCNGSYHTYCVDLSGVPSGPWFCRFCREDGLGSYETNPRRGRPRTRGQQRQLGSGSDQHTHEWTRVWQSVWRHTNIDLDFPFGDDDTEEAERERQQQRELEAISRRLEVAERNGGAARFRDAAHSILAARSYQSQSRTHTPTPESQEEIRAWNAFDKFSQLQSNMTNATAGRKRKSATGSPAEPPHAEPERKLKRPRTRLPLEVADIQTGSRAESSSAAHRRLENAASPPSQSPQPEAGEAAPPSFLQSLLREVELASNSTSHGLQQEKEFPSISIPNRSDSASPLSSPAGSDVSSPRARSLSPCRHSSRPASPPPLSSRIEPIYMQRPQKSQTASAGTPHGENVEARRTNSNNTPNSVPSENQTSSRKVDGSLAKEALAANANISKEDKKEIQTFVTAKLKPLYHHKQINTDEYTTINRQISRRLYDRIAQGGGLQVEERERWKGIAAREVEEAVKALKLVQA